MFKGAIQRSGSIFPLAMLVATLAGAPQAGGSSFKPLPLGAAPARVHSGPVRRQSPLDQAALGQLQCEGNNRVLFRGVCHQASRGTLDFDGATGVLSLKTFDSSGVGEIMIIFKQPGSFQAIGGIQHGFASSPSLEAPGAILDWLTRGEFTETRGGTELGVRAGEGSMGFIIRDEELHGWTELRSSGSEACNRQAQVFDNGVPVGSFPYPCGAEVRTPIGVGLIGLALSRTRSGAGSVSPNLIAFHAFFDATTSFAIPTGEGVEVASGDELRVVFRLPEGASFQLESELMRAFGGQSPPPGTAVLALNELKLEVFDVFHQVRRGSFLAASPNGPLSVQMARETALHPISRVAEMVTEFPGVSSVNFAALPIQLQGGQFLRISMEPYGATLTIARSPRGKTYLRPDFPGAAEVLGLVLREDEVLGVTSLINGETSGLDLFVDLIHIDPKFAADVAWIDWAGHCDLIDPASFELTGRTPRGETFKLRFVADVPASDLIYQVGNILGQVECAGGACVGAGPNGFTYQKIE